jgi:hypothetical protein
MDDREDKRIEDLVDERLEEAEAFERGGEPLEALARARHARRILVEHAGFVDEGMADELRARVDFALRRHEAFLETWQRANAARRDSYLKRERAAIGATVTARDPSRLRQLLARRRFAWGRLGRSRAT